MIDRPLISVHELQSHDQDPDWIVCDCRYDLSDTAAGLEQYLASHIPGAVYVDLGKDLSAELTGTNGRHPLPDLETLSATFARIGISNNSQVVTYDADGGVFASRLWWSLRYLGHEFVAVLDGGYPAWDRAGLPTKQGRENRPARHFTPTPREQMRLGIKQILSLGKSVDGQLLDARAPGRFRGIEEPIDPIAGHIPGALNYDWHKSLDVDGHFLPPEILQNQLHAVLEDTPPERVIAYCGSGVSACHVLLAMQIADMDGARLFPGSWSEWIADPSRPISTQV